MRCPRCNEDDIHGPTCSCGLSSVEPADDFDDTPVPHSHLSLAAAILEARRLGDPSEGDGWRRLLWRLASLLDATTKPREIPGETPKQVAVITIDGRKVPVARTYDVERKWRSDHKDDWSYEWLFRLRFERGYQPKGQKGVKPGTFIERRQYIALHRMVARAYPEVEWLEAAQWAL